MSSSTTSDVAERWLGRYFLRRIVAKGGKGSIYLAQLPGPYGYAKWVAIKMLHRRLASDARSVRNFVEEAILMARIRHPNVSSIIELGIDEIGLVPYQVMEYLHGQPLNLVLRRGRRDQSPLPLPLAVRIVADAARGLHAAHELKNADGTSAGVVHRDVSPQNIFVLYQGQSKILDFGLAGSRDTGAELEGKLAYMAPEQQLSQELDHRCDIWGLGVVLWEATVGRRLFTSKNQGAVVHEVLRSTIANPRSLVPGYPRQLDEIVMQALEREPGKRFPTAAALAAALEAFLHVGRSPVTDERIGRWMARHFADRVMIRTALLQSPVPEAAPHMPQVLLGQDETEADDATIEIPIPTELEFDDGARSTMPPPPRDDQDR